MLQNEDDRLDALHRLNLLDTPPSESFDRITRMAAQIFDLPVAAVSLTDRDRQWFKSRIGIEHWSIPRDKAPCAQVAENAATVLIPDLLADDIYSTSLLASQGVRFYAGASLTTREGHSLGALCVLGTDPRDASAEEIAALEDLAKMVMTQIELQHAFGRLDPLSGLPNRTQFLDDLADLGRDRPGERRTAVLVDLARSEQLNNGVRVMGAAYLDGIVQRAARTICAKLGAERTAYHIAATQFAFLAPMGVDGQVYRATLAGLVARLQEQAADQFLVDPSIGLAPFVTGQTTPTAVLHAAHSAAQDARLSAASIGIYSQATDDAHRRRFRLLNDFGRALDEEGELALAFQPRIDLMDGSCRGVEALLRWHHPELGAVSPAEIIPIVEQTSLAAPTTAWVLRTALAQLARWRQDGLELCMSINISAANLAEKDFARNVQLQLLKHRIRPEWVEMELTESAFMGNIAQALAQLGILDECGIQVAIDDFGTGYSSLSYLQQLPGRTLKIDQSFVRDVAHAEREQLLVKSMITLGHDLGYRVVAEGVEEADARDRLIAMGCDEAQGYFYARPMAADAFRAWLSQFEDERQERLLAAA